MRNHAQRERGAALVIVLIIIVGVIAMLAYLFPLSQSNAKSQGQTRHLQDVQLLLRSALHDSYEEIRMGTDASTDGQGAVGVEAGINLGTTFSTTNTSHVASLGQVLTVSTTIGASTEQRTVGRYMAVIEKVTGQTQILHVVAGYPDFASENKILAGAQIKLSYVQGAKNAFTFAGEMGSPSGGTFKIGNGATINSAIVSIRGNGVEGLNMADPDFYSNSDFEAFIAALKVNASTNADGALRDDHPILEGTSVGTTNPLWSPANAGENWDTISQVGDTDLLLNQDKIRSVADDLKNHIAINLLDPAKSTINLLNDWSNKFDSSHSDGGGDYTDTPKFYYNSLGGTYDPDDYSADTPDPANNTVWVPYTSDTDDKNKILTIETDMTGTGTFLINGGRSVKIIGADVDWTGDWIWIAGENGNSSQGLSTIENGSLTINNGNMYILTSPQDDSSSFDAQFYLDASTVGPAKLTINGGSLVFVAPKEEFATNSSEVQFYLNGSNNNYGNMVEINGLFIAMGESLDFFFAGSNSNDTGIGHPYSPGDVDGMADFVVEGGMVVATANTAAGIHKFIISENIYFSVNFNDANYSNAFDELTKVLQTLIPWGAKGYAETSGATELATILRLIDEADGNTDKTGQ